MRLFAKQPTNQSTSQPVCQLHPLHHAPPHLPAPPLTPRPTPPASSRAVGKKVKTMARKITDTLRAPRSSMRDSAPTAAGKGEGRAIDPIGCDVNQWYCCSTHDVTSRGTGCPPPCPPAPQPHSPCPPAPAPAPQPSPPIQPCPPRLSCGPSGTAGRGPARATGCRTTRGAPRPAAGGGAERGRSWRGSIEQSCGRMAAEEAAA